MVVKDTRWCGSSIDETCDILISRSVVKSDNQRKVE